MSEKRKFIKCDVCGVGMADEYNHRCTKYALRKRIAELQAENALLKRGEG